MAVSKQQKADILESLKTQFKEAKSIAFTSNSGLTVEEVTKLRNSLREQDAKFLIAKKTLIKIAMKEVYDVEIADELLEGQVAIVLSNGDAVAGMGATNTAMKDLKDKITWVSSYFEGEVKDADQTKEIAGLPSKETLLGRLVGSMQSPISALARFLDAAAKEVEEKGAENLGGLDTPAKEEAPKDEEVKEETKAEEAPAKEEEKTEEEAK
jgi:large subunit ribosomal protein L10